jgi:hypothetical protein
VAFWEGKGEDIPTSYLTHAYTLAQLESVVGTLIDGAIEKGIALGVAQIVGREFDGIVDSTDSGIDAKLDVVILANLSDIGGELEEPILFEPFFGLEIETATVSMRVNGLGRVNYDHSEIAHPHELDVVHYSGLYDLTVSFHANVVLYPLGYPCPGTLECDLKGQLLTIANRDASLR